MSTTEKVITDPNVPLHRVVAEPAWIHDGVVSGQAFMPRDEDQGRLSVSDKGADADLVLRKWRKRFKKSKASYCAIVSSGLCISQGLVVIDDSGPGEHHVSVDYNGLTTPRVAADALAEACDLWPKWGHATELPGQTTEQKAG